MSNDDQRRRDGAVSQDWHPTHAGCTPIGCAGCAAMEAHYAADLAAMCPQIIELHDGYDDPMTTAYGAGEVISDSIRRHIRRCDHAWCVAEREAGGW